ncbi:MAG: terpene cyclase/mutase family protein [Planctomycetes bacterium]|nr:terpene cyclase/mutase family protein [Planctomycetota bacterium]
MRLAMRFSAIFVTCAAFLIAVRADDEAKDLKATVSWLVKHQAANGAFFAAEPNKEKSPSLRTTSAAVRALLYLGAEVPRKADCAKFVVSCFDPASGGFADVPGGKPDVFLTSVGIMAVVALKMPADKYEAGVIKFLTDESKTFEDMRIAVAGLEALGKPSPMAKEWLTRIRMMQNADGTFGKDLGRARVTGGAAVAMLRLGGKLHNSDAIVNALKDGQRLNGGYGKEDSELASDMDSTYRVMRAFVMLKHRPPDVEGVASFVLKCRNADGGYCLKPGEASSIPATYYAAIIRHWLKHK